VVIDADEMTALLAPIQTHASAESLYQKSSRFEPGKPLPIEAKGGEPFTMISNALTPYGLTSYAFDGAGVAGRRVEVVKNGVLAQPWATKQFADYLQTTATGGFANWELPAGKTPLADLLKSGERVLLVRNFSWLTPEVGRGNFGSEIRIGYLYEKGVRRPVKGGTVSGNVFDALGTARYSKETVLRGDYFGPVAVRFEGLTIAGA
jgi:predicted Zn-dependent protease